MPDENRPPTVTEVAAAAGVSAATVSRVLTGRVRVSTSARVSVHDAIAQLGYVRHRAPRRTRSRASEHSPVAAVVFEPSARHVPRRRSSPGCSPAPSRPWPAMASRC